MPVNLAMPEVALEVSCLEVEAPDAELASRQRQLQAIGAFRERRLLPPLLGEECRENERAN
jgi:hypothetical protein